MKRLFSLISALAALLAVSLPAQEKPNAAPGKTASNAPNSAAAPADKPADGAAFSCGVYRRIQSTVLGEERTLLIRVPADYDRGQNRYPVLYKLDGGKSVFLQTVGTVEYVVDWEQSPDYIVVGIENTNRNRDMLPDRGANNFVRFLAEELVPFVDANYRTADSRILCGQSTSSVFALYASLRAPEVFDGYVLSSFGLSAERQHQFEEELNRRPPGPQKHRWIYVGNARVDSYDKDGSRASRGQAFLDALKQVDGPALRLECRIFDDQGHVPFPTIHYALRWMAEANARQTAKPVASHQDGRAPGQTPPGEAPILFLPGIVSTQEHQHSSPTFTSDGREMYWSNFSAGTQTILVSRWTEGSWSAPQPAPFSGRYSDGGPCLAPDGSRLYFYSERPLPDRPTELQNDLWYVDRKAAGWSEPKNVGIGHLSSRAKWIFSPSVAANGNVYVTGTLNGLHGLFVLKADGGKLAPPVSLPDEINSNYDTFNWTPFIASDESYLLFSSKRGDSHGFNDLYVSFRMKNGRWSQPANLGKKVNDGAQVRFPSVSREGKALFFTRSNPSDPSSRDDVYWMEAKLIEDLRRQALGAEP